MINESCIYSTIKTKPSGTYGKCHLKNKYISGTGYNRSHYIDCEGCSEVKELRVREGEILTPDQIVKITKEICEMRRNDDCDVDNMYPRYAKCKVEESDMIHRPLHYGSFTPIDAFVSGLVSKEELRGFFKCNIIKYTVRYEFKNGIEDLNKAKEYTDLLIKLENDELKAGD